MPSSSIQFSVFTKPWRMALPELAALVKGWGFDGVELPVRPGYQAPPENVRRGLSEAVRILGDYGLKVFSVAGSTDEATIAACAEEGVPLIRIMADLGNRGYLEGEDALRRDFDRFLPLVEKYGVKVGVQNHYGRMVCHAVGLRRLLRGYEPSCIGAVWDAAPQRFARRRTRVGDRYPLAGAVDGQSEECGLAALQSCRGGPC